MQLKVDNIRHMAPWIYPVFCVCVCVYNIMEQNKKRTICSLSQNFSAVERNAVWFEMVPLEILVHVMWMTYARTRLHSPQLEIIHNIVTRPHWNPHQSLSIVFATCNGAWWRGFICELYGVTLFHNFPICSLWWFFVLLTCRAGSTRGWMQNDQIQTVI